MKPNQLRATVIGLMVGVSCFAVGLRSSFATHEPFGPGNTNTPEVPVGLTSPDDTNSWLAAHQWFVEHPCVNAVCEAQRTQFYNIQALSPDIQSQALNFLYDSNKFKNLLGLNVSGQPLSPLPYGNSTQTGVANSPLFDNDFDLNWLTNDPSHSQNVSVSDLILALWRAALARMDIDKFIEEWKKAVFSADWDDKDRISALDRQWQKIINELIQGIQNQEALVSDDGSKFYVLDEVRFTDQIRAIHRLLHPPDRLHPWLKWLLYLSRVTPEMLQFYQAALEGRDRIFTLASKSEGRLKVLIDGRIIDHFVPFVGPEDDIGTYALVYLTGQRALTSSQSSMPVAQGGSALPQ